MVTKKALIEWIPRGQGGRSKPPTGVGTPPYSTVIRFVDEPWPHPTGWSLVVAKDASRSTDDKWMADVHFLVEEAPHESLLEGRAFELYEGSRCVARGTVLGEGNLHELEEARQGHELEEATRGHVGIPVSQATTTPPTA